MKLDLFAKFLFVTALSLCQLIRTLPKKSDTILSDRRCRKHMATFTQAPIPIAALRSAP